MKTISIWSDIEYKDVCPKLEENITTDVLIIGGGLTGISTAYHLIDSNLKVTVVERNTVGSGVTNKTTGKLTYLQENIYSKIKSYHNLDTAKLYLDSQKDAIDLVKNIIEENNIKCDLEKNKSFVFTHSQKDKINKEINVLKELNLPFKETNILPNGKNVLKSFYVDDTYVFHPIKYLYSLKDICLNNKVKIYENTKILKINKEKDYYECQTDNNTIKAKYIVLALHYPYFLHPFWMPLKTYIEKSYIQAFKVDKNYKFNCINIAKPTISSRYHTSDNIDYQIYLRNSHNTSVKENDIENFEGLLRNNKNPDYLWTNNDIITNDSLPFIGSINNDKTLLIGTGYNTWGMTNGSIAGKILADIILKKENKYIKLFNPLRSINKGKIINFPIIIGSNTLSFTKSKINKQKNWYSDKVKFETRNGKKIAIYTDENNQEHIVYNLCPHLKCSLIFNEIEKTWDCPCHGSRFDIDGKCIEGPSNYNVTYKE